MIKVIKEFYYDVLLEKQINFAIKDNAVPDVLQIMEDIQNTLSPPNNNPDVVVSGYPVSNMDNFSVIEGELASASKMNKTIADLSIDLITCYRSFLYYGGYVTSLFDDLYQRMIFYNKKAEFYRSSTSNLLILANNVEGYLDFVADDFATTASLDLANTTAKVDIDSGTLQLPQIFTYKYPAHEYLVDGDVTFSVITRSNFISTNTMPGLSLLNPFRDNATHWIQQVYMRRSEEIVKCEMVIKLENDGDYFNKIILKPIASNRGDTLLASIEYSMDALNWRKISNSNEQRLTGPVIFLFQSVQAKYWKIKFSKQGYDQYINDTYLYQFGLSTVDFFTTNYSESIITPVAVAYSLPLSPDSKKEFNKVALSACEIIPDQTLVQYEIAVLDQPMLDNFLNGVLDYDDLSFTPIDPIEREEKVNPSSIDYGNVTDETGYSVFYGKNPSIIFFNKGDLDVAVNYDVDSLEVIKYLNVYRNAGDNTVAGQTVGVSTKLFGVDRGWSFDGTYYSTYFYVDADKEIDLGNTKANLDGRVVIGKTLITKGYHTFTTIKDFFRPIDPTLISSAQDKPDIIYPYNHKYLIEGVKDFLYGDDLAVIIGGKTKREIIDPDNVYTGVVFYAEIKAKFVAPYDFAQVVTNDNLNVFSIAPQINTKINYIVVKNGDRLNELESFVILSKSIKSGVKLFVAVITRITLKSERLDISPQVDEYVLRLTV